MPQYGFYDRLSAEFPSQIIVDITEVCNLACIHCPHPEFKKSPHYGARYLELELHHKMVEEVRRHGQGRTQYIRYTSEGEPLINPQCYDMLQYAVESSGVLVTLTTNGTILNEKRVRKLLASGLHMIDVSIDAYKEETYSRIRVHGDLAVTRANVQRLIQLAHETGGRTRVVVSYVEQPLNAGETQDFKAFWEAQGVDHVVVRRLHSSAGAVAPVAKLLWRGSARQQRYPCLYPWERITLNPRGKLAFCPQDWVHGSEIADYRSTTIKEVWHGEFYRRLRQAHLERSFAGHAFCGQCPDWAQTRWPGQGRSYADLVEELKSDNRT